MNKVEYIIFQQVSAISSLKQSFGQMVDKNIQQLGSILKPVKMSLTIRNVFSVSAL